MFLALLSALDFHAVCRSFQCMPAKSWENNKHFFALQMRLPWGYSDGASCCNVAAACCCSWRIVKHLDMEGDLFHDLSQKGFKFPCKKFCVSLPSHEFGWVHLHVFYLFLYVCMSSPTLPSHLPCPINSLPLSQALTFASTMSLLTGHLPSQSFCPVVLLLFSVLWEPFACLFSILIAPEVFPGGIRSFFHLVFLSSHTLLLMLCWYKLLRRASTASLSFSHLKDCMYENAII